MINFHIVIVINMAFLFRTLRGEVFTAMVALEDLVETEEALITIMENYIRTEENKIDNLNRYADLYRKQHKKAKENVDLYLSNPVNAFSLIKRLLTDWANVETLLSSDTTKQAMGNITFLRTYVDMTFPTEEDLTGAVLGLIRLQHMYKLETSSLARGEINGVKYSSELNADDCFEIGRRCYDTKDYTLTKLWMEEARVRLVKETNTKTVEDSEILEYLAYCTFKKGNISLALDLTNQLLNTVPTHPRALINIRYYEETLKQLETNTTEQENGNVTSEQVTIEEVSVNENPFGDYEALCRGELAQPAEYRAKLKCRYLSRNNPFLIIAPFKVEEAHLDPVVYIFHDVISDTEIEAFQILALPRFKRAEVVGNNRHIASETRITKGAWLKNELHPYIADVTQRVADMTGLSMKTAEDFQVLNYGIGGHYQPHFDFHSLKEDRVVNGDRIGTTLIYLSDVAQGGYTVFPNIKTTVYPKKGTAVFWYNLHASGHQDSRTKHAGCPVLAGSKWVATKWIHEKYQEFLRPCTKDMPSNDTIHK